MPGRPEVSFTELEFQAATALGLPRLVFLLRDGVAPAADRRQEAFRRRLLHAGVTVAWVASPADLEIALYQALVELDAGAARRTPDVRRPAARGCRPAPPGWWRRVRPLTVAVLAALVVLGGPQGGLIYRFLQG